MQMSSAENHKVTEELRKEKCSCLFSLSYDDMYKKMCTITLTNAFGMLTEAAINILSYLSSVRLATAQVNFI